MDLTVQRLPVSEKLRDLFLRHADAVVAHAQRHAVAFDDGTHDDHTRFAPGHRVDSVHDEVEVHAAETLPPAGDDGRLQPIELQGYVAELMARMQGSLETDRIEIVSGDRDLLQLVRDPVVTLLFTVRGVSELHEFDEAAVARKYGVPADRYGEFAILRGDPSDGLPGVAGVGEKTAQDLITTFGSLDGVIAAAEADDERIKPAVRLKIRESLDYLDRMRRLVPVNADAPLSLWAGTRDDDAFARLADELGIRGPAQRLRAALDAAGAA